MNSMHAQAADQKVKDRFFVGILSRNFTHAYIKASIHGGVLPFGYVV